MSPEPLRGVVGSVEPDLRLARLRETVALVARMAGEPPGVLGADLLEEDARAAVRLADLPPVARRRYEAVAADATMVARVGLALLIDLPPGPGATAAAARLAGEMRDGIARMSALLQAVRYSAQARIAAGAGRDPFGANRAT